MSTTAHWTQRTMPAMGSSAELIVGGGPTGLLDWGLDELARLERTWSRFRPDSELCQLNEHTGEWFGVSAATMLAICRGVELHDLTGGAFDLTVLGALERSGYDRTFELVESSDDPEVADVIRLPSPGLEAIEIDAAASAVRLPFGVRLDLGGIGKGLAADLVAEGLMDRGAASVLVAVGGDMRADGEPPDRGWQVPVEDPLAPGQVRFVHPLEAGALVTSTTRIRTWQRGGRRMHHIIDPATGEPSTTELAAVVVADGAAWRAEGIAKAAVVAGLRRGRELVWRAGAHGWLFLDDGTLAEVG